MSLFRVQAVLFYERPHRTSTPEKNHWVFFFSIRLFHRGRRNDRNLQRDPSEGRWDSKKQKCLADFLALSSADQKKKIHSELTCRIRALTGRLKPPEDFLSPPKSVVDKTDSSAMMTWMMMTITMMIYDNNFQLSGHSTDLEKPTGIPVNRLQRTQHS